MWGVFSRVSNGVRQEGSPAHRDSVAAVGSNSKNLTLDRLFQAYLRAAQFGAKLPGAQQSLGNVCIETL